MIQELKFDEIEAVDGAGIGEAIIEAGQSVVDAAYDAGHKLGSAVRSLFTDD
ncbi:hypothetical protein INR77_06735 [Erythrobacter sp. SCSIO 43205]|uniref:hypothetical protein n=1 Tax=Erythrobacter sp. SCSIO 43205 TaxID=2779361 RepID=UPI001CA9651B|nr:hypothetical protein [Erythrobacter sp. SCSIO 43205]UAB79368.1 hypothetical protein INR77_06735 [Erythrobacter sp. SCSIO 43205]